LCEASQHQLFNCSFMTFLQSLLGFVPVSLELAVCDAVDAGHQKSVMTTCVQSVHRQLLISPPPDGATSRVGLGVPCNVPPGFSIPCSVSPFVYTHLSQIHGHVIQPSHFWSSSSSCCIQLSVQHLFWDWGVLHSFYMTKPSYSLAFNKPDSVFPLDYGF